MKSTSDRRLVVRTLGLADEDAVYALHRRSLPNVTSRTQGELHRQLQTFPEGQIGVELDGVLVASSSSLIVDEEDFGAFHTFEDVRDGGFIRSHDEEGDTLYVLDVVIDPAHTALRLAERIHEARSAFVEERNLRAILVASRIPGFAEVAGTMSAEAYVSAVVSKKRKDPMLSAHLAHGFATRQILPGYQPSDADSAGYAVFMEWLNPGHRPEGRALPVRHVRVAAVQYEMRPIDSFEAFEKQCEFFIDTAAEYRMDFLLFPELITNQLQTLVPKDEPARRARGLHAFTDRYVELFTRMALKHNVNIIGGSHLTVENDCLYNIAYLFRRDGSVAKQPKLHVTPAESHAWGVAAGDVIHVFDTDRGRIAILICYDVEFPEAARIATAKGANILFVPFNTDIRSGYLRVRSCAQARCIENGLYAVLSGPVGNLPFVEGADIHYAQSCILTPSDLPFARDGIAEEATPNVETMVVQELDLEVLRRHRRTGTVRTWLDRRTDLYRVRWTENGETHEV